MLAVGVAQDSQCASQKHSSRTGSMLKRANNSAESSLSRCAFLHLPSLRSQVLIIAHLVAVTAAFLAPVVCLAPMPKAAWSFMAGREACGHRGGGVSVAAEAECSKNV